MASPIWSSLYFQLSVHNLYEKRPCLCVAFFIFAGLNEYDPMKYARLTQQQLEELHPEFINFLATQSITADEWATIKEEKPQVAEEEIDVFSDLVWEGVLSKVEYLENISELHMHLFHLTEKEMKLFSVKVMNPKIDLRTEEGFGWFKRNFQSDFVEYLAASKAYSDDRNKDKFDLIQQGAAITKGELYQWFDKIME